MKPIEFDKLVELFRKFPNTTARQASLLATWVLKQSKSDIDDLFNQIGRARQSTHFCLLCNNFSDKPICDICSNPSRDKKRLCIVSDHDDINKIEATQSYQGLYFVLGGELDIKNKQGFDQSIVAQLINLIKNQKVKEVLIGTNWTVEGVATAGYIKNLVNQINNKIIVYRLAAGLPINSSLSYADTATLKASIINKSKF